VFCSHKEGGVVSANRPIRLLDHQTTLTHLCTGIHGSFRRGMYVKSFVNAGSSQYLPVQDGAQ